ncbi:dihydrofolate reductase family protein [Taibaiella soli]|uniref:Dihydrofolate reductase n=1 Tax=Taibaiella soli TaxID=1649169 RepID=A0A2W2A9P5_9BACT|nr:dihydrofolate reductase family protein [Taibaiella soli]PZF72105.1 dihydrofolate reductase [Taibaiella soli]
MRKLQMRMSLSIDGFVASANGVNDWIIKTSDATSKAWAVAQCWEAGLHIWGRKSFESMAAYWPTSTDPFAPPMNEIPKAVFTQKGFKGIDPGPDPTPALVSWAEARIFDGDLSEGIKKLKAEEGKPIVARGGAGFMRSLIATGLVDEYHLVTHPVALGAGLSIFDGLTTPLYMTLKDEKVFLGGITARTYVVE